jgi:hypothetical protein
MNTHIENVTSSEFIKHQEQIHASQKYNRKEEHTSWTQKDYSNWWQKTLVLTVLGFTG